LGFVKRKKENTMNTRIILTPTNRLYNMHFLQHIFSILRTL
jgi:hypothetical protein